MPNVPFLPVPLPQQVSFPGDLAALMPAGLLAAAAKPAIAAARRGTGRRCAPPPQLRPPRHRQRCQARALSPLLMPLSALP